VYRELAIKNGYKPATPPSSVIGSHRTSTPNERPNSSGSSTRSIPDLQAHQLVYVPDIDQN
jgi:hypothetical protein